MAPSNALKSGTTSISEHIEREVLNYSSVEALNEAWIEKLARAMLNQKRAQPDASDREVTGLVNSPTAHEKYVKLCTTIASARKPNWKGAMTEEQWQSVQGEAIARYRKLLMRESAPPLPEPAAPPLPQSESAAPPVFEPVTSPPPEPAAPEEEEIIIEGEIVPDVLPESLRAEQWHDWTSKTLTNETVGNLNFKFANALAAEISRLSDEQMKEVKSVYSEIIKGMYAATYPGEAPENIGNAIESYWVMVLAATRLIAPAFKPAS